jgi:hypothetical protein
MVLLPEDAEDRHAMVGRHERREAQLRAPDRTMRMPARPRDVRLVTRDGAIVGGPIAAGI